ncbi:MAG: hypothetical protein ACK4Z4_10065 [Ferrovibrio sp.]
MVAIALQHRRDDSCRGQHAQGLCLSASPMFMPRRSNIEFADERLAQSTLQAEAKVDALVDDLLRRRGLAAEA